MSPCTKFKRSRLCLTALDMEGWKEKSKSASVLTNEKPALRTLRSIPCLLFAQTSLMATADIQWDSLCLIV